MEINLYIIHQRLPAFTRKSGAQMGLTARARFTDVGMTSLGYYSNS